MLARLQGGTTGSGRDSDTRIAGGRLLSAAVRRSNALTRALARFAKVERQSRTGVLIDGWDRSSGRRGGAIRSAAIVAMSGAWQSNSVVDAVRLPKNKPVGERRKSPSRVVSDAGRRPRQTR